MSASTNTPISMKSSLSEDNGAVLQSKTLINDSSEVGTLGFIFNTKAKDSSTNSNTMDDSIPDYVQRKVMYVDESDPIEVEIAQYFNRGRFIFEDQNNPSFFDLFACEQDSVFAKIFTLCTKGMLIAKNEKFYLFDDSSKLWKQYEPQNLSVFLLEPCYKFFPLFMKQFEKVKQLKKLCEKDIAMINNEYIPQVEKIPQTSNEAIAYKKECIEKATTHKTRALAEINKCTYYLKRFYENHEKYGKIDNQLKLSKRIMSILLTEQYGKKYSFNTMPYLIPTKGRKIYDISTGEIRDRQKEDFFTFESPYEYIVEPDSNIMEKMQFVFKFIAIILGEYNDLNTEHKYPITNYFIHLIASSLSGTKPEGKIAVLLGVGSNGKSTLVKFLQNIFPTFCEEIDKSAFIYTGSKEPNSHSPNPALSDITESQRLIIISEISQDENLNEHVVKCITGQEGIRARKLYHNGEMLHLNCLALFQTNNIFNTKFTIALLRRFVYFQAKARFVDNPHPSEIYQYKKDPKLIDIMQNPDMLLAGFNFFLRAATSHYLLFKRSGCMLIPEELRNLTIKTLTEADPVQSFIAEEVLPVKPIESVLIDPDQIYADPNKETAFSDIMTRYINYLTANNLSRSNAQKELGSRLKEQFGEGRKSSSRLIYKLSLRENSPYLKAPNEGLLCL